MARITNRFKSFQEAFKQDVGKDWKQDIDLYLAYYQARVTDELSQIANIQFGAILGDLEILKKHLNRLK